MSGETRFIIVVNCFVGYHLISAVYTHDDLMRLSGVEYSIGTEDEDYPNTVTQTYDYLTYTDVADDEYESHLISSVTTVFPQNGGTETLNYTYDSNGNITEIPKCGYCADSIRKYGYPTSFLEEDFGGLDRKYDPNDVLQMLFFISDDEPSLIEEIESYIKNANKRGAK